MRKAILTLCCALWAMFSTNSTRAEPCPKKYRAHVQTGELAPCDGYLLSEDALLALAEAARKLKVAEQDREKALIQLGTEKERRLADRTACNKRIDACDEELAKLRLLLKEQGEPKPTPLVERPWFVATISIVVTAAIAVPVTWLAVTEAAAK